MTISSAFFSLLLLLALLAICTEFVMRIRLTVRATDKMAWWRRGGDEVADSYQIVFSGTRLQMVRNLLFWLVIVSASVTLVAVLWKQR